MHIYYTVAFAALLAGFVSAQCNVTSCVGLGDQCFTSADCAAGLFDACSKQCPEDAGCVPSYPDGVLRCFQTQEGLPCAEIGPSQCNSVYGPYLTCSAERICVPSIGPVLVPNDYCDANEDCRPPLGSLNGLCVDGRCRGNQLNVECNTIGDCDVGLYCVNSTCQTQLSLNAPCDGALTGQCAGSSLVCARGSCIAAYSLGSGAQCDSYSECGEGLGCFNYSTCEGPVQSLIGSNCSVNTNECTDTDVNACTCDQLNGNYVCGPDVNLCTDLTTKFLACLDTNNCHYLSDIEQWKSCARENCLGALYDTLDCLNNKDNFAAYYDPTCYPLGASASSLDSILLW